MSYIFLVDKKADLTAKTENGLTALDIATGKGFSGIAEILEQAQKQLK